VRQGGDEDKRQTRAIQRLLNKEKANAALRLQRRDVDADRMIGK
jgi:hypothetical protein